MAGNKTLAILKPDTVQKKNAGKIIQMILDAGFEIRAMKLLRLELKQAEKFYDIHREKSFFNDLTDFMTSGAIIPMILEKENAVEDFRKLIGATDPEKAEEGTVRKLFSESVERNAVHGSDSDENAERECDFFFEEFEIV